MSKSVLNIPLALKSSKCKSLTSLILSRSSFFMALSRLINSASILLISGSKSPDNIIGIFSAEGLVLK